MKTLRNMLPLVTMAIGLTGMASTSAFAGPGDIINFQMVISAGAASCISPDATAFVTVSDLGPVQNMHVDARGLPPNTEYDFFVIQVPNKPFGLSWYQADIETNSLGRGIVDLTGIFSRETFILAPGVAPAPKVFPDNATSNPATPPVQTYHLGLWFASPTAAVHAGCPGTVTPFAGDHNAGIQVLNTSNFAATRGPLSFLK